MKTWITVNKSKWGGGPWSDEPDKAQWIDEETGLDCLTVRGPAGALCGYVGVPESHPYFGDDYGDHHEIKAHGGLTFSGLCAPSNDPSEGICHTGEVANKKVWWFGFDCAHCDDICPKYEREESYRPYAIYRNFNYVKTETEYVAKQLRDADG